MSNLSGLDLLSHLSPDERSALLGVSDDAEFGPGDTLITEGRPARALWIVAEGLLEVSSAAEPNVPVARIGPGGIVGELSFVLDRTASATVTALERTMAFEIRHDALVDLAAASPATGLSLWRALAVTLAQRLVDTTSAWALARSADPDSTTMPDDLREILDGFDALTELPTDDQVTLDEQVALGLERLQDELQAAQDAGLLDPAAIRATLTTLIPHVVSTAIGRRVWDKPRGYVGDAETIDMMYRLEPSGVGALGTALDRALLNMKTCSAARNRRGLLAGEIRRSAAEGPVAVTSLACGPAREIFDVLASDPELLGPINLVDLDPTALEDVRARAEGLDLINRLQLHRENLIKLAIGRENLDLPPQDLVYSIGLIDYFPDELVVALLNLVHGWLRPGGRVILGNFHPSNPVKAFMDTVEWHLIHRSEDDMNRLYEASSFARPCEEILWEDEHINLFAVGRK